jgi:hypothetical protein
LASIVLAPINIADGVTGTIVNEFGIGDRLGYFVLDNAENNDTAIATFAHDEFGFDADER